VRDFGGEQAEGGEAFAGPASFFFHVDDAGEEPFLFRCDGGEVAERGEDFDFVVLKKRGAAGCRRRERRRPFPRR